MNSKQILPVEIILDIIAKLDYKDMKKFCKSSDIFSLICEENKKSILSKYDHPKVGDILITKYKVQTNKYNSNGQKEILGKVISVLDESIIIQVDKKKFPASKYGVITSKGNKIWEKYR